MSQPAYSLTQVFRWYNRCATTGMGLVSWGHFLLL